MPVPNPTAVSISRHRRGRLLISIRYTHKGRPATPKQRASMVTALLQETLDRLKDGSPADIGFREDAQKHIRTDQMEA